MKTFQSDAKDKHIANLIKKIIQVFLIILVVYNIIYVANNVISGRNFLSFFEITLFTVDESQMKPLINKNDFVIIKKIKEEKDIKKDDVIAYSKENCLKIRRVTNITTEYDKILLATKTDNGLYNDLEDKTLEQVNGKVIIIIPFLGLITRVFQSKIITILVTLILGFIYLFNREAQRRKQIRKKKKNAYYI